jgi:hypothetical protein
MTGAFGVRRFLAGWRTPVFNSTREIAVKKVVAIKSVRYNKHLRVPNTESAEFDARPSDAKVLVALGKVRYAEDVEKKPAPVVTRSLTAQEPSKAGTLENEKYLRRDVSTENITNKVEPVKEDDKDEGVKPGRSKYLKEDVKQEAEKEKASKTGKPKGE